MSFNLSLEIGVIQAWYRIQPPAWIYCFNLSLEIGVIQALPVPVFIGALNVLISHSRSGSFKLSRVCAAVSSRRF